MEAWQLDRSSDGTIGRGESEKKRGLIYLIWLLCATIYYHFVPLFTTTLGRFVPLCCHSVAALLPLCYHFVPLCAALCHFALCKNLLVLGSVWCPKWHVSNSLWVCVSSSTAVKTVADDPHWCPKPRITGGPCPCGPCAPCMALPGGKGRVVVKHGWVCLLTHRTWVKKIIARSISLCEGRNSQVTNRPIVIEWYRTFISPSPCHNISQWITTSCDLAWWPSIFLWSVFGEEEGWQQVRKKLWGHVVFMFSPHAM